MDVTPEARRAFDAATACHICNVCHIVLPGAPQPTLAPERIVVEKEWLSE